MDNSHTQTTFGTIHRAKTNKIKSTAQKAKTISNTDYKLSDWSHRITIGIY